MPDELISRQTAESALDEIIKAYIAEKSYTGNFAAGVACDIRDNVIAELPSVDAVSRGVFEQFKWERDVAMEQLEEHGIAFGAKKQGDAVPVVCCGECAIPHNKWTGCPKLGGLVTPPDFYCAYGERKEDNAR